MIILFAIFAVVLLSMMQIRLTGFTCAVSVGSPPAAFAGLGHMTQLNIVQPEADVTAFADTWQFFSALNSAKRVTAQIICVATDTGSANPINTLVTGAYVAVTFTNGTSHTYTVSAVSDSAQTGWIVRNVQEIASKRDGSFQYILDVASSGAVTGS